MAGRARVTSAYLLSGDEPALVETGPTTSSDAVTTGLEGLGLGPGDLAHAVFTGDALGIHLPDVRVLRPATPPPDIDIELGVQSIERIRCRAEAVLLFSHFGPVSEAGELCSLAASRLRKWADIVKGALEET